MRQLLALLAGALAAASLAAAAAAGVPAGTVHVNRGLDGATLGMTKAQVRTALGPPEAIAGMGRVFEWQDADSLAGVYFDQAKHVRLFVLAGREYCTGFRLCLDRAGGVGKLRRRYGSRLVKRVNDDGLACYQLVGTFRGRSVFTVFLVTGFAAKARVYGINILWGSGDVC
jgi:hypothetical protein